MGKLNLVSQFSRGLYLDEYSISCTVEFSFVKKVDLPFKILEVKALVLY